MKIFIILAPILALAMSDTVRMIPLQAALQDEVNSIDVGKELSFGDELDKLKLTSLRDLLVKAKLFDDLNNTSKSHTVFAPTNAAFDKVPSEILDNTTKLIEILSYHIHNGAFRTNMIHKDMVLKTLLGGQKKIRFEKYDGNTYGSCKPFGSVLDETYDNGMLDTINGVMIPPEGDLLDILAKDKSLATFQGYVSKDEKVKPFIKNLHAATFLAPNDAAFKKLPADAKEKIASDRKYREKVILYHFVDQIYCSVGFKDGQTLESEEGSNIMVKVSGEKVMFNNGSVLIQNDTIAYNGVFHIIDTVLLPPP